MRIVIDLQGAQSESRTRGIGRYSQSFAQAIARNCKDHEIILALSGLLPETIEPIRRTFRDVLPQDNIQVWGAPGPVRASDASNSPRRHRAEIIREAFLASLSPDIVHVTSMFEGFGDDAVTSIGAFSEAAPTSVTLYDLIPLRIAECFSDRVPGLRGWYSEKLEHLLRADLLLGISEHTVCDARSRLGRLSCRITNVSTGCSDVFSPKKLTQAGRRSLMNRLKIPAPFIITSGTIEPHKNQQRLFEAFARLPSEVRDRYCLVLVGKVGEDRGAMWQAIRRRAGLPKEKLIITGYVSDYDLAALYSICELMVFPSLDEGFGLPALEAMSCGAPTIGSRAASIPEVIGIDDALFDPRDAADITRLMTRALVEEDFRAHLKSNARRQADCYSWDVTAKKALQEMSACALNERKDRGRIDSILPSCVNQLVTPPPSESELLGIAQSMARTFPRSNRQKQLLVDVSELCQRDARTGCQRVTRSVVLEWLHDPPEGIALELVHATLDSKGYRYCRDFASCLSGRPSAGGNDPIDYAPGDIFFGLDYQSHVVAAQASRLRAMKQFGVRVYFLVYDVLPATFPHYFPKGTEDAFCNWLKIVGQSDGMIGISKATMEALKKWYSENGISVPPDFRFDWVHLGADIENSAPTFGLPSHAEKILSQLRRGQTFLMVGTVEPRKGYAQALAAFELLWNDGVNANLVIIGGAGWNTEALMTRLRRHPRHGDRLFWLESVSDEYLDKVYASSTCLLAASESEGFGLPLIEAARQKLPILARDIPVFREVAGEHAFYFSGSDPSDLFRALKKWLALYNAGEHPKSAELPWITWKECARQILTKLLINLGSPRAAPQLHEQRHPEVQN